MATMYIDEITAEKIKLSAQVEKIAANYYELKKSGKEYSHPCPSCGKSVTLSPSKQIFKCFSCDRFTGSGGISYVMQLKGIPYPEALQVCADICNIIIPAAPVTPINRTNKPGKKSFAERQLFSSGLTSDDVKATVYVDEKTEKEVIPFQSGTLDQYHNLVDGDDMVIQYYDLAGKQVTYLKQKTNKMMPFFRMRWQYPDQHLDKEGRSIKYQSPAASGNHIYIPEAIRKLYKNKRPIKRLYIQEGEKKAEKSCKHGILSIGIAGIHNLAYNSQLPHDLQLIIQNCAVEQVVFILDSDLFDISQNIVSGNRVDLRPRSFFEAVKNFRDYMKTFRNQGIYLEVYFGHVPKNELGDKGIDDYLFNTLKGRENYLKEDIDRAINEKTGQGEHIHLFKITEMTDGKLAEFWCLQSAHAFAERHKEFLSNIPEFKFGKHMWRFREGKFESAQPIEDNEQYWEEIEKYDRAGNKYSTYNFDYMNLYNFLRNRGFNRFLMANKKSSLVHIENMVVDIVESYQIKDYVMNFTEEIAGKNVINMLYRGGKMYLGPDSLNNLKFIELTFLKNDQHTQILLFNEKYWKITSVSIEEKSLSDLEYYVWKNKINKFKASRVNKPLLSISEVNSDDDSLGGFRNFNVNFGPDAKHCDYLQFLINTSNFWWKKQTDEPLTDEELQENRLHLVAKLTAFGYLTHQFFDPGNAKAIIGMDGKISEIGSSNGGSGKSIFGEAIGKVVPQVIIPAKAKNLTEDPFLFEMVNETTDSVFLDDVRANLDFEHLFPFITGNFMVNQKGIGRFTIEKSLTPKFYIPTNHAINGEGSSYSRRQSYIAFSDYYNDEHRPIDDFGKLFFDDWGSEDWNLFYNLVAECVQLYLRLGLVEPPMDDLEKRRLRQKMGEEFLAWAELYYSIDANGSGVHINNREPRKDIYDNFLNEYPQQRKFVTATKFKQKIRAFCRYKGFKFNPHLFDRNGLAFNKDGKGFPIIDDKSGGVEYFTIGNESFDSTDHMPF